MHSISIFGWKRNNLKEYLDKCYLLSKKLAEMNYTIYTGGGTGYMEQGNKGAFDVDTKKSIAVIPKALYDIEIPNKYIGQLKVVPTFAERKKLLMENKKAIVIFPGGMGTMDEFTDLLNILKTGELKTVPKVYLVGTKYWGSLKDWFIKNTNTWPEDYVNLITDDIQEILNDLQ